MTNDELPDGKPDASAEPPISALKALRDASEMSAGQPVVFQLLDPRVIHLWRLQAVVSWSILFLIAMIAGGVMVFNFREAWPWMLGGLALILPMAGFSIWWFPQRAYRVCGYRIDEKVLESRAGIWFQVITLLPLSRLQHVDLNRGPLERMFGLTSLHLHTAGTEHSSIEIEGLADADALRLRDHLVAIGAGGDDAV